MPRLLKSNDFFYLTVQTPNFIKYHGFGYQVAPAPVVAKAAIAPAFTYAAAPVVAKAPIAVRSHEQGQPHNLLVEMFVCYSNRAKYSK
jgi:hypothetical protein